MGARRCACPASWPSRRPWSSCSRPRRFPAERALELGLLNEIVEEDELLDKARDWAARINANGPLAVRATKESVLRGLATDMQEAYRIESELGQGVFGSEDAKEGPKAFAEKRPPNWQGR